MNDVTIKLKELISQTNNIMVSDSMEIEKNIYEELLINFVNSILVKNSNDINNIIINNTASNRLNNSISNPLVLDYDDAKMTKFVINYSDNTSDVRNFYSKTYSSTENRCTYTCIIYVPLDKSISNIQIKSNDENTTYLTIDTSSLVAGKYYRLSQDLVVE